MSGVSTDGLRMQAALSRWFAADTRQGVFATDDRLRIVVWNRWMEMHSGYTSEEVLGLSLFELYAEARVRIADYYEEALRGHVTVISHGLHRYLLPFPPTHRDLPFAHMPQSGYVGPLSGADGVLGTITILEDVSDRLASEAQLRRQIEAQREARAAAERASRAKDEFLSTLSHEIRTPLNAVLGWARILLAREEFDPELLKRALGVIERNAASQAKMMDDMLDMARIVAGKLRMDVQPVDLLSVILAAVDVVRPSASAKQIALRTSFDPETPRVLGDPDRLQQVVWNVLSNAVKFTDPGGVVAVSLDLAGQMARITVKDSGQGISPEFLPHVFERFRQGDASSTRKHGGLGLGLALARELVELHGGRVTASSKGVGLGSTFTIELPTAMSPEVRRGRSGRSSSAAAPARALTGVSVLIVDDETDARDVAAAALEQSGALVDAVASAAEALQHLASCGRVPDVLVSDIGMPNDDGLALIRAVRTLAPEAGGRIPAVALTGYTSAGDVARALEAGYHAHVSKPIDPADFAAAVAGVLRRVTAPERPESQG